MHSPENTSAVAVGKSNFAGQSAFSFQVKYLAVAAIRWNISCGAGIKATATIQKDTLT